MGDIIIMARRLDGGKYVQYGWCGNGGYCRITGLRLLNWYNDPKLIEYLFGLGQLGLIGKPGSENGGYSLMTTHNLTHEPHWLGTSEREIFSRIAFIDYGYFYDTDNTWYYVIPGPFRIKIPLLYISQHLDDDGYEFDECKHIESNIAEYIMGEYYYNSAELRTITEKEYAESVDEIKMKIMESASPIYCLYEKYGKIFSYFDDWAVVKTDEEYSQITGFLLKKKQGDHRIETIEW